MFAVSKGNYPNKVLSNEALSLDLRKHLGTHTEMCPVVLFRSQTCSNAMYFCWMCIFKKVISVLWFETDSKEVFVQSWVIIVLVVMLNILENGAWNVLWMCSVLWNEWKPVILTLDGSSWGRESSTTLFPPVWYTAAVEKWLHWSVQDWTHRLPSQDHL